VRFIKLLELYFDLAAKRNSCRAKEL